MGREPEGVVGDAIAEASLDELCEISRGRTKIVRAFKEMAYARCTLIPSPT